MWSLCVKAVFRVIAEFCYCLGPKGESVQPPRASTELASCCPWIIPLLWRSAPLHTAAPVSARPTVWPQSPKQYCILCTYDNLEIWAPEDFTLQHLVLNRTVHEPKGCANVYVVAQKKKILIPNFERSHLCHCIVLCEQNVKHTKEHTAPLLPLPLAFSLRFQWNKAQCLPECMGGKSETDISIVIVIPNNGESVP